MITVIASIRVKAGKIEAFLDIMKANLPYVLQEEGCIEYSPTVDLETGLPTQRLDANVVTLVEKWESVECLHAHLKAPHIAAYRAKTKDMVEEMTIRVLKRA
ncbi:MAG: antibiotic biosynthesis monooxygenase [Deltaproteobacteria bacterium]|nr:antibiotic biosynthesis monooxygenase [Deltaproteobacteria bacterium]